IVPDILKAGIPVFTEKPLCVSVESGEKLVALGEKLNVLHVVGNHKRSDPAMEYAKKLVDEWKQSGEFGRMKYIRVTMPPGDWINGVDGPIMTDEPKESMGEVEPKPAGMDDQTYQKLTSFVNFYIHQVNAIHFMLGEQFKV